MLCILFSNFLQQIHPGTQLRKLNRQPACRSKMIPYLDKSTHNLYADIHRHRTSQYG